MTIKEALNVQNRTVSSRDAEVLLGHVLATTREFLHTYPEKELTDKQSATFENALTRREKNEPVAYITGVKEFYSRPFKCDNRALIPRPETEALIERSLILLEKEFKDHLKATNKPCPLHVLEIGTGCGNIAVTLALELAKKGLPATILATDISKEALDLAQENATALKAYDNKNIQLTFLEADLFDHAKIGEKKPYDLIAANLPYVSTTWQLNPAAQPDVVFYEPDIALFGGEDGLVHYRKFFKEAPAYLAKNGHIVCEYGEDETIDFIPLAKRAFPGRDGIVYQDYAGLDRIFEL